MKPRDANDVLRQDGPDALRQIIDAAEVNTGKDKDPREEARLRLRWHRDGNTPAPRYLIKHFLPETGTLRK
jgi:hypothetical protein